MRVLSLCDYTGNMVKPWAEAGYECWIVDIQHNSIGRDGNILKIEADILEWEPPNDIKFDFISCFPPCTDLAVSGARWFREKGLLRLAKAIEVFGRCVEIAEQSGSPYCIENPVSVISSHYRKPDYTFDPCDYGDPYTKKTCLWTGGAL